MFERADGRLRGRAKKEVAAHYVLPDPAMSVFDRGIGELRFAGELVGHLASALGEMGFFEPRQPWPWFLVIWLDGSREPIFEDYGPEWLTVKELDEGHFHYFEPSAQSTRRILGTTWTVSKPGPPREFEFIRLAPEDAERKWNELALLDSDF